MELSVSLETGKIVRVFILSTSFMHGVYLLMLEGGCSAEINMCSQF